MSTPIVRYRKLPVVVDTIQWTGTNLDELIDFTGGDFLLTIEGEFDDPEITAKVYDSLHDTWIGVKTGQRVLHGVKGETYPIDVDALAETYELVDDGFFQVGHTYAHVDDKTDWRFRVDTVTTHPEDGERTALGWRRFRGEWEPYAYGEDDFEIHLAVGTADITNTTTGDNT